MDRKLFLKKIINDFEDWWIKNPHRLSMDFYQNTITASSLDSLSEKEFIDFFYSFVRDGGRVQSGGHRKKNIFLDTIEKNTGRFRAFVLEPFQEKFSPKHWFSRLEDYKGFGVGIATIFLNRINYEKYPIMNNKTLKGLSKLGYEISLTKNWTNYELVKKYQEDLLNDFPTLQNYFKTDALNHFVVTVCQGQELIADYLQIENFDDELEQHEIENIIEIKSEEINKEELYKKIIKCESLNSEKITISGKIYKRYKYSSKSYPVF